MSSWNLLGKGYEKIPLLASANLWGDYLALQLGDEDLRVRIHVAVDNPRRGIAGLLKRACADVLVVDHEALVRRGVWRSSLQSALAKTPCVLICLSSPHLRQTAIAANACLD